MSPTTSQPRGISSSNSADDDEMASVCIQSVEHCQQNSNWDCGLSCVLMALSGSRQLEAVVKIKSDIEEVCQSQGFGHSTWTIDLCYLMRHFAPDLRFAYTTVTMGVDPGYEGQVFYNKILQRDAARVNERFTKAEDNDIIVKEASVTVQDMVDHVASGGTCIVLTNANLLSCESCNFFSLCMRNEATPCHILLKKCTAPYQGHYVLVVGYDLPRKKIIYRNPTLCDKECVMSFANFDEARTSYGTDEDVVFVN